MSADDSIEVLLLGIAQDAGVPQAGCYCNNCQSARLNVERRHMVACLGLIDHKARQCWLIDATPDFKEQLHYLQQAAPDCLPAGVLLTHVHMGHYTGLIHLGPEAMNVQQLPLYCSEQVEIYLRENRPWANLFEHHHLTPIRLQPTVEILLTARLRIVPVAVPHRDEHSDTLAFIIKGSGRQLFYCPDIDGWDQWSLDVRAVVAGVDIALLDGSFFSPTELPGRDIEQIPHPPIHDTVARLKGIDAQVIMIHLNHSNPLLADGPERAWLRSKGFDIGRLGQTWVL